MQAKQFRLFTQGWETALANGLKCRLSSLEEHELSEQQQAVQEQMQKRLEELETAHA